MDFREIHGRVRTTNLASQLHGLRLQDYHQSQTPTSVSTTKVQQSNISSTSVKESEIARELRELATAKQPWPAKWSFEKFTAGLEHSEILESGKFQLAL